ncbi:nitric oxide reductase transcriptional regulator NorR [Immundisolibacter sp.]|uniref:nitric oxide reductase transcriptional regulator NorR n=1 Tax=Immundisolibacter sp. TaxID=1934948 RepID=UPI0035671C90
MTPSQLLGALAQVVDTLTRDEPDEAGYTRLLEAVQALFPCDATALLRLDGDTLRPLAVTGLSHDTLGRRFRLQDHPRLLTLLQRRGPTRLAADCQLPDPYDGLVEGRTGQLEVHDCMGCPLYVDDRPWGLLTLDALDPRAFGAVDLDLLEAFGRLAGTVVVAGERLSSLAQRAQREQQLARTLAEAPATLRPRDLIGRSPPMRHLQAEIDTVAATDLTVLISGETGVGKELVAQAIHARSHRAEQPLITLNCAALPDNLVESELFGHVRGAFTGAVRERCGKFELADGGTLLLDEIGELPMPVQAKLLRVLQSGQLQRLGSDREHHVDVRVLAATNRDLAAEVRAGRFRADLYHRLSAYPLTVPPLRARGRDVLLLAGGFLEENRVRLGLRGLRLAVDAQHSLLNQPWPGNVRELEHLIGRAALRALAEQPQRPRILTLHAHHLNLLLPSGTSPAALPAPINPAIEQAATRIGLRQAVDELQSRLIRAALARHAGNWATAARELRVDRANLRRLAGRLGLA